MRDREDLYNADSIGPDEKVVTPEMLRGLEAYQKDMLKKNSNQVAKLLATEGFKGKRNSEESCPLAIWWKSRTGADATVKGNCLDIGGGILFSMNKGMEVFVKKFDAGKYPELEAAQ